MKKKNPIKEFISLLTCCVELLIMNYVYSQLLLIFFLHAVFFNHYAQRGKKFHNYIKFSILLAMLFVIKAKTKVRCGLSYDRRKVN